MSSCGVPMTRVSLTPAPSDVGMPRRVRVTVAWVFMAWVFPWGLPTGWRLRAAAPSRSRRTHCSMFVAFRRGQNQLACGAPRNGHARRFLEGAQRMCVSTGEAPRFEHSRSIDPLAWVGGVEWSCPGRDCRRHGCRRQAPMDGFTACPEPGMAVPRRLALLPSEAPGAVDARVAGEVRRDRGGADVLAGSEAGDGLGVEAEAAEVVGEIEHATRGEALDGRMQQAHMA